MFHPKSLRSSFAILLLPILPALWATDPAAYWTVGAAMAAPAETDKAQWVAPPGAAAGEKSDPQSARNRFHYFRKVVQLAAIPEDATLRFAADSNARLWINGQVVRRKVARYHMERITAEVVNAAPYLRAGANVIVVLHHNWGDIVTFQRTGNRGPGLYLDSSWVRSDASWRCLEAPEFARHAKQVVGVIGDHRIRYPQIIDGRKTLGSEVHAPSFDDGAWSRAVAIGDGPWPAVPRIVETPGQREHAVGPMTVLAAGTVERSQPLSDEPLSMAAGIRTAKCVPDDAAKREAAGLLCGRTATIVGRAGQSAYLTFDFFRPVHGYPLLKLADAPPGARIDFGYGEIARSQYDGRWHVEVSGWLNPEGVVGPGYADRYITRAGRQAVELPDERTARWMTLHVHFSSDGPLVIEDVGIVKSQYPIRPVGSFACGDQQIDQIVKLCLIHAEVTMTDAYVDTPGREDGQWLEDDRPRALLAARWFGDTKLREFFLRTHAEGQREDGLLHSFAPSNYPAYPAAFDWSVQWVAALYDDYQWTGRPERIRRYWDTLARYWKNVLGRVDDNGIFRTRHVFADIRVGLHCTHDRQSSGIVTPWIIQRLRWSAEMAEAVGEIEQGLAWRETADRMARAFRKHHLVPAADGVPVHVGDRFDPEDASLERGHSQAGHTVAVTSGLLTREEAWAALDYAFADPDGSPPPDVTRWNNPTYGYRALRALSHVGLVDRAVRHLLERYAPYLPGHPRNPTPLPLQGPYGGPLPEYWISREDLKLGPGEVNSAQPRDETGSHGWAAVPLLWLHDTLLGVRIAEPGGGRLRIAPHADGLPYVAGHTNTPKGLVWVHWDPQQWTLEVAIPRDVTAEIVLPPSCRGKRIVANCDAGDVQQRDARTFVVSGAGAYVFEAR
ncbi:MAG: hypothetical protein JXB62_08430 [Pirellulales bacterium]|nr:hypothetical protein [Pirellulales bacterium]